MNVFIRARSTYSLEIPVLAARTMSSCTRRARRRCLRRWRARSSRAPCWCAFPEARHRIDKRDRVTAVVMFGRGRDEAGILVEPAAGYAVDTRDDAKVAALRDAIWCVAGFHISHCRRGCLTCLQARRRGGEPECARVQSHLQGTHPRCAPGCATSSHGQGHRRPQACAAVVRGPDREVVRVSFGLALGLS